MQARVKWVEGLTFLGESASGHQILMDGNSGDKAPSPMEMVLMAAGGCSAIDVVSILQKGRQDVVDCEVKLTSERREEAPRLFTHINLHFIVTYSAAIFLIPICISFDTAEKRRYATYLILNRRFSFEF